MIFPGFPGVLSFFQVFQVEWEPCQPTATTTLQQVTMDSGTLIIYMR